jgi:hypothetical protein
MHKFMAATLVAVGAVSAAGFASEPLQPGYKVGEPLRVFVNEYRVTGPNPGARKGDLVCHYGRRPVVMVYARAINASVVRLVKKLDEATGTHQKERLGSYLVLICDSQGREAELKALAEKEKLQQTPLAMLVINEAVLNEGDWIARELKHFDAKFNAEAEVTVVLARDKRVRASYAYRKGKFKDKDVDQVLADLPKILTEKE